MLRRAPKLDPAVQADADRVAAHTVRICRAAGLQADALNQPEVHRGQYAADELIQWALAADGDVTIETSGPDHDHGSVTARTETAAHTAVWDHIDQLEEAVEHATAWKADMATVGANR